VILIMTSNIGAELIKNKGGFGFAKRDADADYEKIKQTLTNEIERFFRPEFINRLDDIIVFRPLVKEDLHTIVEYELKKVFKRLEEREIELQPDESAKDFLIEKGYNPDYGARPLRRAIAQFVEDPLSEALLREEIRSGQIVILSKAEDGEKLDYRTEDKPTPEPEPVPTGATDGDSEDDAVAPAGA
ncbi:MAG: AAA family ATPase, partial [Planctomycetota bacterium]